MSQFEHDLSGFLEELGGTLAAESGDWVAKGLLVQSLQEYAE